MEGKLINRKNGDYNLKISNSTFATTNQVLRKQNNIKELSIKNCESIANGYDLDEIRKLADEDFECELGDGPTTNESINSMIKKSNANGAEWGFKKALEILSDKKFSEEDVKFMFQLGFNLDNAISRNEYNTHIQSLQQTEWDVEIVMDICGDKVYAVPEPALDENGCLILRRI
jgi:hypothetical protein